MFKPLIDADVLLGRLEDPTWLVFDCRHVLTDPGYGRAAYAAGHVSGARFADVDSDLADAPGVRGRHPLPDRGWLARRFGEWGVGEGSTLVAYDDAGGMYACRFWWLARWLGVARVAVLDGGIDAFVAAGGVLSTEVPRVAPTRFVAGEPLTKIVEAEEILARDDLTLIDARARARYLGLEEPMDPKAGHIPGAVSMPCQENLDARGCFIRDGGRFAGLPDENVVSYCGSGITATHNILAMVVAGLPEPALYPGSWSEWVADPSRPIEP